MQKIVTVNNPKSDNAYDNGDSPVADDNPADPLKWFPLWCIMLEIFQIIQQGDI